MIEDYNNFGLRRKRIIAVEPETRMSFWRTAQRQEVDLIEVSASGLRAYEIKWNPRKTKGAFSKTFTGAYPEAKLKSVSPHDYAACLL